MESYTPQPQLGRALFYEQDVLIYSIHEIKSICMGLNIPMDMFMKELLEYRINYVHSYCLTFGKYKGISIEKIAKEDIDYLLYILDPSMEYNTIPIELRGTMYAYVSECIKGNHHV